ncbi:MAG: hypothetical protein HC883_05790 [Bdellovibrionaceae bacterium]|nr:hypothetical protein [Pseudobdellovibrionaceae bacterium]
MPRWIWVLIAIGASTAIYFTIRYGLRPKPIPVMNPTHFESAEQIGIVVYKRLRQNVRADRLVLLGSSPGSEEDNLVWEGFAKAAAADGETVESLQLKDVTDRPAFFAQIQQAIDARRLVLVQGLTPEVSHLVNESWSKQLDRERKHPVLSLAVLRLAINPAEYDDVQTQCLDTEDLDGHKRLQCASQRVARKYLKRKLAPEKIWAVMERHGLKEYLLFIHRP